MITTSHRHFVSRASAIPLIGALLLLAPALVAADVGSEGGAILRSRHVPASTFSLGIDAALPAMRIAAVAQATANFPGEAIVQGAPERPAGAIGQLRLPDVRDLSTLRHQQEQTSSDQIAPRWGGFGRWVKRHWWVPVLAAGAVAYAVSESGGDDDRLGEDD